MVSHFKRAVPAKDVVFVQGKKIRDSNLHPSLRGLTEIKASEVRKSAISRRPSHRQIVGMLRKKDGWKKLVKHCSCDYLSLIVQGGHLKAKIGEYLANDGEKTKKRALENFEKLAESPAVKNGIPKRAYNPKFFRE